MSDKIKINNENIILDKILSYKKERRKIYLYRGNKPTESGKSFLEKVIYFMNPEAYLEKQVPCNEENWSYEVFEYLNIKFVNEKELNLISDEGFKNKVDEMNEKLRGITLNHKGMFNDYRTALWRVKYFYDNFQFCKNQSIDQLEDKLNNYFS